MTDVTDLARRTVAVVIPALNESLRIREVVRGRAGAVPDT